MTPIPRITRKQARTMLQLAKTDKGRAHLRTLLVQNTDAHNLLDDQVRLGVDTPEVKKSLDNVIHNVKAIMIALGRFPA